MTREEIVAEVMKRLSTWAVIGSNEKIEGFNTVFGRCSYAKGVIISSLSCTMLGNLANGCGGGDEQYILSNLCKGKTVLIKESGIEYRKYSKSAPKNLYNMYRQYEQKLYMCGMKLLESNEIKKHLITAADLENISTLKIDKSCIISPLAQDYIKQNNITVIRS